MMLLFYSAIALHTSLLQASAANCAGKTAGKTATCKDRTSEGSSAGATLLQRMWEEPKGGSSTSMSGGGGTPAPPPPPPTPSSFDDITTCACKYAGSLIPSDIIKNYPLDDPGKYDTDQFTIVAKYGTTCAAWDSVPGTPWFVRCAAGSDWAHPDYNWCQQPWCYVDASCPHAVKSEVFKGSNAIHYSYQSCGHYADCFTGVAFQSNPVWPTGCPYDPTGTKSYKVHKNDGCECQFHGTLLRRSIYRDYPEQEPGKYANYPSIDLYGTTCGAWDRVPGTPWFSYCPANASFCHQDYNWCQIPWCYVSESCATGKRSAVFNGSTAAFYSYDTCMSAPDCYTDVAFEESGTTNAPSACPFDMHDTHWSTKDDCTAGWNTTAP